MTEKEKLIYSTVKLQCTRTDGLVTTGTGFFYNLCHNNALTVPCIVTNNHVIKGGSILKFRITLCDKTFKSLHQYEDVEVKMDELTITSHPDNLDLCIIFVAPIMKNIQNAGKMPLVTFLDKHILLSQRKEQDLSPIEDILMVGYPDGIDDSENNLPITRKGITATPIYEDYNGTKMFLIDATVLNGSSGSPVFIFHEGSFPTKDGIALGNRIALLGIISSVYMHPIEEDVAPKSSIEQTEPLRMEIPNGLGIVIKATELLAFEKQ